MDETRANFKSQGDAIKRLELQMGEIANQLQHKTPNTFLSNTITNLNAECKAISNRRDKPIIKFDPEIEKTLKKNRSRVKAQRSLQFDQEEANSEEGASEKSFKEEIVEENTEEEIQNNMADNANNQLRTLVDYTNPTTASCGSSIVWPTVDANNFE
ncbi:hypothetical protein PIB30_081467 [Stylosanthes scabra]|uniref:Uncharacterized protein n=1 Tax=Stylosanthes scabra TaxID=79078 RepID=A0ABU6TTN3_9FABA|nr:hypothetical protein [Stylosanthes scabra]